MRRSILLSILVLAVAGLVVSLVRPSAAPTSASPASASPASYVTSTAVRSCPQTFGGTAHMSMVAMSTVPSAVVPPAEPATGAASATLTTIGPPSVRLASLSAPAQQKARWAPAKGAAASLAVGNGSLAAGLAASTWTLATGGRQQGFMAADCVQPRADYWFVGGGAAVGRTTTLIVSNPDPTSAQATVSLIGNNGPVVTPTLMGFAIGGRTERSINLSALAPAARHLVVHVRVDSGHLAAWMVDSETKGRYSAGIDYVPTVNQFSRSAVLPGVAGGRVSRELLLYVPGTLGAQVTVHVISATGFFVPSGLSSLTVPPGRAVAVPMSTVSLPAGASLVVTSNQPLLATEHDATPRTTSHVADTAYAAAASPVDQAASTTAVMVSGGWHSEVVLAAPGAAAQVQLVEWAGPTTIRTTTLLVPAGQSRAFVVYPLGRSTVASIAVVPLAGSGQVFGALSTRQIFATDLVASVRPLVSSPLTVQMPTVESDPRTALNTSNG
jgi:Family of unknown function (DUF5719)